MIGPFLRRTRVYLSVYYAWMMEYRAEIFLWVFATALPLFMLGLWQKASSGDTNAFALSPEEFVRYFLAVFIVRQVTIVWVIYDFEYEVVTGRLTPFLLWPLDPAWRYIAGHISEQGTRAPFFLLLFGVCLWLYPEALRDTETGGWWRPDLGGWGLALLAIYGSFVMRFLLQYTIALFAFWVERVQAFDNLLMLPYYFLGGLIAPLEVFPPLARELTLYTPFPYMLYFPATLITGQTPDFINIGRGFAVITGWVVVLFIVNRVVWRLGLKHYSGMGA